MVMKLNILACIFLITVSASDQADANLQKKLPVCLKTSNCVSSQANFFDKQHYIKPFEINGDIGQAWELLRKTMSGQNRMVITHETGDTVHAEATSLVFQFVDDIDLILDNRNGLIHVRSASRLGHYDFAVNRKRIENLRKQLQTAGFIK